MNTRLAQSALWPSSRRSLRVPHFVILGVANSIQVRGIARLMSQHISTPTPSLGFRFDAMNYIHHSS